MDVSLCFTKRRYGSYQHCAAQVVWTGGEISQRFSKTIFTSNDSTDCEDGVEDLGVILLIAVYAASASKYLTIATTIVASSHPQARTMRVRTKHLKITLINDIAKNTEVTIRIALFRLLSIWPSSMVSS